MGIPECHKLNLMYGSTSNIRIYPSDLIWLIFIEKAISNKESVDHESIRLVCLFAKTYLIRVVWPDF